MNIDVITKITVGVIAFIIVSFLIIFNYLRNKIKDLEKYNELRDKNRQIDFYANQLLKNEKKMKAIDVILKDLYYEKYGLKFFDKEKYIQAMCDAWLEWKSKQNIN